MRTLVSLFLVALLTACGGGGGGGSTPTPTPVSLFSSTPLTMPDLRPYYTQMCGDQTGTQVTLADLNKDGKQDLVVTFNCHLPNQVGQNYADALVTTPANGGLVIFLQQADGSFVDSTQQVLGTSFYHVNGLTRMPAVVYDFNGDGYVDLVFAINNEDGRVSSDLMASNFNEPNLFLMSNGNGTYTASTHGISAWNYNLELADNTSGGKDLISSPIGYGVGDYGMTYQNGWNMSTTDYSWVNGATAFFSRASSGSGSSMAIVPTNNLTVTLYQKNGTWAPANTISLLPAGATSSVINMIDWNGGAGTMVLLNMNGANYIDTSLENSCMLKLKKTDTVQTAIFTMISTKLNNYTPGTVLNLPAMSASDTTQSVNLVGFTVVNNSVVSVPLNIKNQLTSMSGYNIMCGDFNGDGSDDIAVTDWQTGSVAAIYINDGNGNFDRINPASVPGVSASTYTNGNAFIIADINGDGIMDLLYYPVNGVPDGSVTLQVFLGKRNATTSDLV